MIDWFKNIGKDYPEFWKYYVALLETPTTRKVALHIETTGLNPTKDRIISIGAIAIENNKIVVESCLEIDLNKDEILTSKEILYQEAQAIESLINFIGNATLIGHRIHQDIEILNEYLSKLQSGRMKSNLLDVEVMHAKIVDLPSKKFALEELLSYYSVANPEIVSSGNSAYTIAILFLKMRNKLGL